jgi:hypothetical protein
MNIFEREKLTKTNRQNTDFIRAADMLGLLHYIIIPVIILH